MFLNGVSVSDATVVVQQRVKVTIVLRFATSSLTGQLAKESDAIRAFAAAEGMIDMGALVERWRGAFMRGFHAVVYLVATDSPAWQNMEENRRRLSANKAIAGKSSLGAQFVCSSVDAWTEVDPLAPALRPAVRDGLPSWMKASDLKPQACVHFDMDVHMPETAERRGLIYSVRFPTMLQTMLDAPQLMVMTPRALLTPMEQFAAASRSCESGMNSVVGDIGNVVNIVSPLEVSSTCSTVNGEALIGLSLLNKDPKRALTIHFAAVDLLTTCCVENADQRGPLTSSDSLGFTHVATVPTDRCGEYHKHYSAVMVYPGEPFPMNLTPREELTLAFRIIRSKSCIEPLQPGRQLCSLVDVRYTALGIVTCIRESQGCETTDPNDLLNHTSSVQWVEPR